MFDQIPLYFIGALVIAGGFAMVRWGWPSQREEDRSSNYEQNWSSFDFDFRIGHLTVGIGFALVVFGGFCIWGASQGWNTVHVLKEFFSYFNKNWSSLF